MSSAAYSFGRTIPLRIAPVAGEAFDSWTERIASGLGVEHAEALFAIGAISEPSWRGFSGFWNVMLPAERIEEIARRCGLCVQTVAGTLLDSYHGRALDCSGLSLDNALSYRSFVHRSGAFLSRCSRACPACLDDNGAWMLRWRLPWSFACTIHGCLLLESCPRCQAPLRRPHIGSNRAHFIDQVPRPAHCTNPTPADLRGGGRARPCGQDLRQLATLSLAGNDLVLDAQQRLDAVLRDGKTSIAGQPASAWDFYHDLGILARQILHFAELDDPPISEVTAPTASLRESLAELASERDRTTRSFRVKTPPNAALMALTMAVVLPILAAPDAPTAGVRLRWLIQAAHQQRSATATHLKHSWGRPGPVLSSLYEEGFNDVAGHSDRLRLPRRRSRDLHLASAHHVPQLAWADLYDAHFGPLLDRTPAGAGRAMISVCIARALDHTSWPTAARALGFAARSGTMIGATVRRMGLDDRLHAFNEGISSVVKVLDEDSERIDFTQRRHLLADPKVLDPYVKRVLEQPPPRVTGEHARQRLAAIWLWATITGGCPLRTIGWARLQGEEGSAYPRFCVTDAVALAPRLERAGANLLADAGLPGSVHPTSIAALAPSPSASGAAKQRRSGAR